MSKDHLITIRLNDAEKERYDSFKQTSGLRAGDMLMTLIDSYYAAQQQTLDAPITLIMELKKESPGLHESIPPKKIVFRGAKRVAYPPQGDSVTTNMAANLTADFGIEFVHPISAYKYLHALDLYYHDEQQSFLAHETFLVFEDQPRDSTAYSMPLNISRCLFVSDYDDLCNKFQRYTSLDNLDKMRNAMATDIDSNYDQMALFFSPNEQALWSK